MKISELVQLLSSRREELEEDAEILAEGEDGTLYDIEIEDTEEVFDGFDTFYPAGLKIIIKKNRTMDNKKIKEEFVQELIDLYVSKQDEENWNLNDGFHVTMWFLQGMIARIADNHIVPLDELHRRITKLVHEQIEDTFRQLTTIYTN